MSVNFQLKYFVRLEIGNWHMQEHLGPCASSSHSVGEKKKRKEGRARVGQRCELAAAGLRAGPIIPPEKKKWRKYWG